MQCYQHATQDMRSSASIAPLDKKGYGCALADF